MERLEADLTRAQETKPISTKARPAIQDPGHQFTILENPDVLIKKLGQQESEITKNLRKLKQNRVKLDKKRKTVGWYHHGHFPTSTRQSIKWKIREIWELKQYLNELHDLKRPGQRKNSHICSRDENLLNEQLVKLHKGTRHGSINLVKERQLLKQIKQARGENEKMSSANIGPMNPATLAFPAALAFTYIDPYTNLMCTSRGYINPYSEEAITDCIKALSRVVEDLRMNEMRYEAYNGGLDLEEEAIEKEIRISERKLENIKQKKVQLASKSLAV